MSTIEILEGDKELSVNFALRVDDEQEQPLNKPAGEETESEEDHASDQVEDHQSGHQEETHPPPAAHH